MVIIPSVIKEKLHNDEAIINIRLHFPNGERADICNDLIVNGTAKLTESLCSQNELKFGLCESPTFECETVGVGNLKGATFELTYEIICDSSVTGAVWKTDIQQYVFEMRKGTFIVQSCERQADMQHRKIVAYGGAAAVNWELPKYEQKIRTSRKISVNCDIFKSFLTNFDLGNFNQVDSGLTTEIITVLNESSYYPLSNLSSLRIYLNYLEFETPSNNSDIYVAEYTETQTSSEIVEKLVDFFYENVTVPMYQNDVDTLNKFANVIDKGNCLSELNSPPYYKSGSDYKMSGNTTNVNKKQYFYRPNTGLSVDQLYLYVPYSIKIEGYRSTTKKFEKEETLFELDNFKIMKINEELPSFEVLENYEETIKRDIQSIFSGGIEIQGKLAKFTSNNRIDFVEIKKQFYLKPSDDLRPSDNLRPLGVVGGSVDKAMYSNCWYDENYTKPYGAVYCSYTNTNNEKDTRIDFVDGYNYLDPTTYQTYDLSNNAIIQQNKYTEYQISIILQAMAESISGVTYVPSQLSTVALPYIECGDTLEVLTENNDSINTIVLKRVLSGESYVTDQFISK